MQHILFTCAGRRNYLINYFKEALNGNGKIFAADQSMMAPAMMDADVALEVPGIYDPLYIKSLVDIIRHHDITAIISLNDLELPILAEHRSLLESHGARVIVSNLEVISTAFDKWKTFEFLKAIGLNTPKTYTTLDAAKEALSNGTLQLPLVVKPRWGSASIGIDFPESKTELDLAYQLQQIKLRKSILKTASKEDFDNAIIIQEKLDGVEYGMDILNDFNGHYIDTFSREKLSMRSGETDKAMSPH